MAKGESLPQWPGDFTPVKGSDWEILTDEDINKQVQELVEIYLGQSIESFPDEFTGGRGNLDVELDPSNGLIIIRLVAGVAVMPKGLQAKLRVKIKKRDKVNAKD